MSDSPNASSIKLTSHPSAEITGADKGSPVGRGSFTETTPYQESSPPSTSSLGTAEKAVFALNELEAQMALLRKTYAQQLPGKMERLQQLYDLVSSTVTAPERKNRPSGRDNLFLLPGTQEAFNEFHRMVHNMAGSGTSYGFTQLSETALDLDNFLKKFSGTEIVPGPDAWDQISVCLRRLAGIAQNPADTPAKSLSEHLMTIPSHSEDDANRLIYLVEDDQEFADDLQLQIGHFGYTVRRFEDTDSVKRAVQEEEPAVIIADVVLPEGSDAGFIAVNAVQKQVTAPVPVMFLSSRGDMLARLQAVRAGGKAYFTKPIDPSELIDKLDALTSREAPSPYRILIIDDEAALASYYALTLESAGMKTAVVTDPLDVTQTLTDFRPDLILMDVYMPVCTGLELATVIRQQADFVSIPIVFLSAECDIEKQLAAMSSGGDDFLTKPIEPSHLISSVTMRAHRSRTLRSFMIRDSLTGLLNHTTIKERLGVEVMRAARNNGRLSFAMLDIDSFKSVNDRFGHLIGDRVIKSLSRLLQQRLRKTDILGRYGGEEFAIILNDTDGKTAVQVMDGIRQAFSQIRHRTQETEFEVTFSCGIAEFPTYTDTARLNDAADKALYVAKHKGRNQVVLSDERND
jgi:diguanylate cyclase (GGDEF)-like protein